MIFLTVGNWHKGFKRLVKAVDELKGCGLITEEIIAQIGPSDYKPKFLTAIAYCSLDEFAAHIKAAGVIIAHAGIGTITHALKLKKTVIVVPRKASLGEHFDDHQFATAQALESEHKILVAYETDDIVSKLEEAKNFVPTDIVSCEKIVKAIEDFIDKLAKNAGR